MSDHHRLTISTYRVDSRTGARTPERTLYEGPGGAPAETQTWPPCDCPQAPECQHRELAQTMDRAVRARA